MYAHQVRTAIQRLDNHIACHVHFIGVITQAALDGPEDIDPRGRLALVVADADGRNLRQLTRTREDESSPTWSPDGRTICVATRMDGRRVLATVSVDGGPLRRLPITGVSNPSEPDWSPDGKWIAFTSLTLSGFSICLMPAQGGTVRVLAAGEDPVWAPNSRVLLCTQGPDGAKRLYLLDVPTKHRKDLGRILESNSQPSWCRW